jgi:hypothetical protein
VVQFNHVESRTLATLTPAESGIQAGVRAMRSDLLKGLFPSSIEPIDDITTDAQDSDVGDCW